MSSQRGILVIWDTLGDGRQRLQRKIEEAVAKTESSHMWKTISALASVYDSRGGFLNLGACCSDWGVESVGLLFLHLNNDAQRGFSFYAGLSREIPAVLFSSDVVNADFLKRQLGEDFSRWQGRVLVADHIESSIDNVPFWFSVWKESGFDPQSLRETKFALEHGDGAEAAFLALRIDEILTRFLTLGILLRGYLKIYSVDMSATRGGPAETFPNTLSCKGAKRWTENLQQAARDRLLPEPGSQQAEGPYWFDACAEDVRGPSPFTLENDRLMESILDRARTRFANPDLSMLRSSSQGALQTVWKILSECYSKNEGSRQTRGFADLDDEQLLSLFRQAHREYVTASKRIDCYLERGEDAA